MKIQEMRSGILHLNKRMENEGREEFIENAAAGLWPVDITAPDIGELDQPIWSVISFERREAGGLTYQQATDIIAKLNSDGVPGLCIVTDNAGKKVKS